MSDKYTQGYFGPSTDHRPYTAGADRAAAAGPGAGAGVVPLRLSRAVTYILFPSSRHCAYKIRRTFDAFYCMARVALRSSLAALVLFRSHTGGAFWVLRVRDCFRKTDIGGDTYHGNVAL